MDLSQLKFSVNTEELKTAVGLLKDVQAATAAVNKEQSTKAQADKAAVAAAKLRAKEETAAAATLKKTAQAAEEVSEKVNPLEKLLEKLKNQYGDLVEGFTKGEASILQQARNFGAADDALKPFINELQRIKELTKDPFDASVGAIRSVTAEFDRLKQRSELASQGISLTTKQLSEYSRISAEVKGKVIQLGLDPQSAEGQEKYNKLLKENRDAYIDLAAKANALEQAETQRNNALRAAEKANIAAQQNNLRMMEDALGLYRKSEVEKAQAFQQRMKLEATAGDDAVQLFYKNEQKKQQAFESRMKSEATMMNQAVAQYYKQSSGTSRTSGLTADQKEQARAAKWLANEESRLVSVVNSLSTAEEHHTTVSEKAARSIANYERNLRQAGVTGEAAAAKLDVYRKQQSAIQSLEEKRQGKFLTRALQPQIGDVAISLAAGQNPLTVLLQQGDQIRGLIAQTGVQGEALRAVMRNAFTDTIKSVKDTAVAMGSVLGGAVVTLGKNFYELAASPITAMIAGFKASKAAGESLGSSMSGSVTAGIKAATAAMINFSKLPIVLIISAIVATGVAAFQSMTQQVELSKALAKNSAAFGMNRAEAVEYVQSLGAVDNASSKYLDVMLVMAETGFKVGDNFKLVSDSALAMEKYAGVALKDTLKSFQDLATKPYEGMVKLAKATGQVPAEVIKLVAELERQGKVAEASAIATQAMADVNSNVVKQIAEDAGYLERVWTATIDFLKGLWNGFRDSVMGWGAKDTVSAQIKGLFEQRKKFEGSSLAGADAQIKKIDLQIEGLRRQERSLSFISMQEADRAKAAEDMIKTQNELNDLAKAKPKGSTASGGKTAEEKRQEEINKAQEVYNDLMNKGAGFTNDYNNKFDFLNFLRNEGVISQREYYDSFSALQKLQPVYLQQEKAITDETKRRADNQEWLNNLIGKGEGLGKEYASGGERLMQMLGEGLSGQEFKDGLDALNAATPAAKAYAAVMADYGKTMSDIQQQRKGVADQYGLDFKTDKQKTELESLNKFTKSQADAEAEYTKNVAEIKAGTETDYYKNSVAKFREMTDAKKLAAQELYEREKYLQSETYQLYSAGFDALKGLAADFGGAITDEFMNFARTGKSSFEALTSSFGNMVENMIYDLIRLRIQKQVTGLFDQLITMGIRAIAGPSMTTGMPTDAQMQMPLATQADGGAWMNGVQMYAKGGVFNGPTMFQHSSGLGVLGEEGSEAVMPLKRDSSGSLGVVAQVSGSQSATSVVINNYSSEKATATESVDSRGNRSINVTIGDMVASEVTRSGSSTQNAMRGTFGMQPQLIRR